MDPTFRPQPLLGVSMAVAAAFWLSVLVFLIQHPIVPPKTYVSAVFFVVMFMTSVLYYARTAIVVDHGGVTYRGIVRVTRITFAELQRLLQLLPAPPGVGGAGAGAGRAPPGLKTAIKAEPHRRIPVLDVSDPPSVWGFAVYSHGVIR